MKIRLLVVVVMCLVLMQVSCNRTQGPVGSKGRPIKLFFMPLKGDAAFKMYAPKIVQFVEKTTGLTIEPVNSDDFITIVRAFTNNQADVAFMNTLGYLLARDMAKVEAHLMFVYDDIYKTYRGEIIAKADGPINSPTDMTGKTLAFSDPFSASGYLYAQKFLNDHNIKPAHTVFAGSHKKAIEMVYDGEVDAAATYHSRPVATGERDARIEITTEHPDVLAKIKVVAVTDEVPNGPVAFRKELPEAVKSQIVGALMEYARTVDGRQTLQDLYNMTGFAEAKDSDYDGVQGVIKNLGKKIEEIVPGGITFYKTTVSPILAN